MTIVFDGIAFGMLLFLISVGLSVTLGLMNFVNLAHGAFAMLGGYVTVTLINNFGWPFLATLPVSFVVAGAAPSFDGARLVADARRICETVLAFWHGTGEQATPDELDALLLTKSFAKWQLPERYEFIDAVPRTSTGKFWKLKLRERFPR